MWRDRDRFPATTIDGAAAVTEDTENHSTRPFGLRFVDYSPGRPRFVRPEVTLCPDLQIGLVDGEAAIDVMPVAASMSQFESDGKDVLVVDWGTDDK